MVQAAVAMTPKKKGMPKDDLAVKSMLVRS
jgi:hypothetical protein